MSTTTPEIESADVAAQPERKHRRYQRRGACVMSTLCQSATLVSYEDYKMTSSQVVLPSFKTTSELEVSPRMKRFCCLDGAAPPRRKRHNVPLQPEQEDFIAIFRDDSNVPQCELHCVVRPRSPFIDAERHHLQPLSSQPTDLRSAAFDFQSSITYPT
eukprot:CAMPEP_0117066418 /NCGR_PEP_ID=MMETSP0472-20121206/46452_1 /TAXON_ID=693140 ORGANISM="Tiarina fusus, Strain LIS" /NCGR_SAMPLE_ID=MMETSP0472 /ASSEMBLY_ACC=CAM_ASM_000603 /LENGTH=157 /DNA_ID=CAMNT_0004787475 /DNA_START=127 /DNA_END=598 /DNA_ORIENTATION=+